jgi:S-methylmethionine-dependent homocysteine/selenocysteine methylase
VLSWELKRAKPLVAFSSGPYGAALADGSEYDGSYADSVTEEQLIAFHRERCMVCSCSTSSHAVFAWCRELQVFKTLCTTTRF